jgi:hypothetical protein
MKAVSVCGFNPQVAEFLDSFGSPFTQRWFLDIAKGDGTLTVSYVEHGGEIVACLPIVVSRTYRIFFRADTAGWTHVNGPVTHPCLSEEEKAQAVSLLLNQLSRWISYKFVCEPADRDVAVAEPFQIAGFKLTRQITYLRMPCDPDVLSELGKRHRNNINRAARNLQVTKDISAKEFMHIYLHNLKAADKVCYADPMLAKHLIEAGQTSKLPIGREDKAKRVLVFEARANSCEAVAAIACLLNKNRMYYWLATRRRFGEGEVVIKGSEDAIKLLLIHACKEAKELNLIFDADGVSTPSIGPLYERFFPHQAEREVFTRRAPHDPWGLREVCGKKIGKWLNFFKNKLLWKESVPGAKVRAFRL